MPNKLRKYLKDYLSKAKKPPPQIAFPSRRWIRSGCKHPKTLSFAVNRDQKDVGAGHEDDAATLDDIDNFLFENFRSLYLRDVEDVDEDHGRRGEEGRRPDYHHQTEIFWDKTQLKKDHPSHDHENEIFWDKTQLRKGHRSDDHENEDFWNKTLHFRKDCPPDDHHRLDAETPRGDFFESQRFHIDPPGVDLCGSHRFFVSPGRASSSVMEEARTSTTTTTTFEDVASSSISTPTLNDHSSSTTTSNSNNNEVTLPKDCIAVLTYSPSPYDDFRRSMHVMVESRLRNHAKVDWNFMEELLFCYLNLNEKKSYRFVLSAFADLIVDLRQNSDRVTERSALPKF